MSNDTMVTVVGNVATSVEYRESATGGVARFRFAVTGRRWDRQREVWADGSTSFYTVWAWRTLGLNLAASVSVGEPLVVHGRLKVREEERDGQRRTFVDIDAVAVGHDLARGTSAFRRMAKGEVRQAPGPTTAVPDPVPSPDPALAPSPDQAPAVPAAASVSAPVPVPAP
ncbi:single-stranded DNA-binding protein [Streptomyces sp. NPDC000410]|uniref:single-stranded DNA-binding protein n=1 Tax=Streptomyces sp. NPDC000410 TaxID=3154254 RepID=UPI003318AA99